jgi:hypothetical protein
MERTMRSCRYIAFVLVVLILFGSTNSCITEKKVTITPQNKILFTAKQAGVTNIVKLNFKSKTKQIVASFPIKPEEIIVSPDQKKIALYFVHRRAM